MPDWLPIKDAAERLGISPDTIKRRTRLPDDDPKHLQTEREHYRNGERILVAVPPAPNGHVEMPAPAVPPALPPADKTVELLIGAHMRQIDILMDAQVEHIVDLQRTIARLEQELARERRPWWRRWIEEQRAPR